MIQAIGNEKIVVNSIRVDSNQTNKIQTPNRERAIQQDQNQHCSIADIEEVTDITAQVQVQAGKQHENWASLFPI